MNLPIKNLALMITLLLACLALAGCGNKGPLVKPSAIPAAPAVIPADAPAADTPAVEPATTPAAEPASDTPAARR